MKQIDVDKSKNLDVFNSFHQRTLDRFAHHLPTPTPPPHAKPAPDCNKSPLIITTPWPAPLLSLLLMRVILLQSLLSEPSN